MAIGQFFLGAPNRLQQIGRFTPEQTGALNQLLGMGLQGLQNPYEGFAPIAQQARSQFQQQTVPSLAERFSSLGNNATSSPAFASQLGQAGAGLEEGLAALQSQYGMANRGQLMQLLQLGLQPQYEYFPLQAEPGLLQSILPALGRLGAHTGAAYLTGGASAVPSAVSEVLRLLSGSAPQTY